MSRVLIHAQHLSGVGHHVRMDLLARGLARRHEVYVVDGGEPVPRRPTADSVRRVPVPRLRRREGRVVPLAGTIAEAPAAFAERARLLVAAVRSIRPALVIVEHFPFSKWELADEILRMIAAARAARPDVRVIASIRDIVAPTRFDAGDTEQTARVLATLDAHFDMLLVHSDPRFVRVDESFPRAAEIPVPVVYTGYVSERSARGNRPRESGARVPQNGVVAAPAIVASSGGGSEGIDLGRNVVRAFRLLAPRLPGARMTLFAGLFWAPDAVERLRAEAASDAPAASDPPATIRVAPFGADFLDHLATADVSVSRAGYNTCVNVLETCVRAVLVPSARRSDQRPRAARLHARGLAAILDGDLPEPAVIAEAVLAALAVPRPACDLDLDGVERGCTALDDLLADTRLRTRSREPA